MTRFQLQVKSVGGPVPVQGGAVGDPREEAVAAEAVEQHEWAGDLYENGDESDPALAYARFTGGAGEESWLDRADDGTLSAWVRDADGSVYRYPDVDAWAIDVDGAQMAREDAVVNDLGEEDEFAEDDEFAEEDPLADPDAEVDPFAEDEPLLEDDELADDEFADEDPLLDDEAAETELIDGVEVPLEGDEEDPLLDEEDPDAEDEDDPDALPFKRRRK